MNTQNEPDESFPPLSPTGESILPNDADLLAEGLSGLEKMKSVGKIDIVSHTLTKNIKWGAVLRIDFTIDQNSIPGFVNRALFWRAKNGTLSEIIAIGQDLQPLSHQ
ncbi:MAG TPA: hypothetical protein VHY34_07545 [Caulobacteraceae bacterium]|jgi:hypothetical protein|nr:hypothetical protein [Caulobacteraceae bacterium]